jgi:DNA-binding XRE family transcriptional regulator
MSAPCSPNCLFCQRFITDNTDHVITRRHGFRPLPRLKEYRTAAEWTQNDLANAADITQDTVSTIENGASARRDTARALAAAFGVTVNELEGEQ